MNTNISSNNLSTRLQRHFLVICLLTFLLVVGMSGEKAQTAIRATPANTNSPALRANGKIAFTSDRDGNQEIYVMNNDGTGQVRLTNNPGVDDFPTWSRDGRKIAFVSQNAQGTFTIKLMNADGTNQTQLTPLAFNNGPSPWHEPWSMSWSPDGAKIAFEESGEIFTINVDGNNRKNLTNHPAFDYEPSWSPDGSRIIFASSRVSWIVMHTMNADGSDVRALPSDGDFWDMSPDWSPSGDQIAFVVHAEWNLPILYTANADGTNRQIFDYCEAGLCSTHRNKPKWSPDGTKIVFHIWEYFSNDAEIYVKNVNGSGLTQLTNIDARNYHPSWQPLAPVGCSTNPIDCADVFVRQHYLDFLNRQPDAGGLAYWTGQITQCGNDLACVHNRRIDVSAAFFFSLEFQQTGSFVYGLYKGALGRQPNYPEFTVDHNRVIGGPDLEAEKAALANDFTQRPEFLQRYPGAMTNSQFVNTLFDTAGLFPFTAERQAEIEAMNNQGRTRAQVLRNVTDIQAFRDREFNPSFVLMQYFGYMRRDIDQGGYEYWLDILNRTGNFRGMVCAFITSSEYQLRFGPVTRSNADCSQ